MTSIVAPGLEAEVEYRRERITQTFRQSKAPRKVRASRSGNTPRPRLRARAA